MVKSKRILCLSLAVAGGLLGGAASRADSGFRCGSRVVSSGDHMLEVRKRCGEPDFVGQKTIKRKVKIKRREWVDGHVEDVSAEETVDVLLDEWTYDLGPRRFIRFVLFEDGRVVNVATGGYGTKAVDD
jgi:Protein of unknown function (DUF2845)